MRTKLYCLLLLCALYSCQSKSLTNGLIKFELADRDGENKQEIDPQQAKEVLTLAEKIYTFYIWKGYKIATLTYEDGSTINMRISNYGGFFYSKELDSFYEFTGTENRNAWHDLLNNK